MKKRIVKIIALLAIIASFGSISTSSDAASQYIYKYKVYCYVTDGYKTPDGKFFARPSTKYGWSSIASPIISKTDTTPNFELRDADEKNMYDWISYMYNYDPEEFWFMQYLLSSKWNNIMRNKDKNGRLKEDLYDEQGNYLASPSERLDWYDRNIYPKYLETLDKYRVEHAEWIVIYDDTLYNERNPEIGNKNYQ